MIWTAMKNAQTVDRRSPVVNPAAPPRARHQSPATARKIPVKVARLIRSFQMR